ncbi:MAG: OmpA family protein [Candidatus Kapabacteria bacterium]|nr:OmpA family protein [Candidatus Kapabacteria bacterium]
MNLRYFKILILIVFLFLFNMQSYSQAVKKIQAGDGVNTLCDETNPHISYDGKTLYFIRTNDPNNTFAKQIPNSQDIWYSTLDSKGKWSKAKRMDKPFNQRKYNSLIHVSKDGTKMLIRGAYEKGKYIGTGFSTTEKKDGKWTDPEQLEIPGFKVLDKGASNGAFMSFDEKVLLICLSESEQSKNYNIFISFLDSNKNWTKLVPLPETINSASDEFTPCLSKDNMTMYFSSNREGGYGLTDIYESVRLDNTWQNWSTPQNLGTEINTDGWDGYLTLDNDEMYAYMVLNNKFSAGDIIKFVLPENFRPKQFFSSKGKVLNSKTKTPIDAEIHIDILPEGNSYATIRPDAAGNYQVSFPIGQNYAIYATADKFLSISENINLFVKPDSNEVLKNLELAPLEIGSTITLKNLFFDFAKSSIRPESFPELDRLVNILKDNPGVNIEVSGHTDNVGSEQRNLIISKDRANAVKTYLITKGIGEARLTAAGYGKEKSIATNDSEEGKQMNRRVEITITK